MYFDQFNFTDFWNDNDYSVNHYMMKKPTEEDILKIEKKLGYTLPDSYKELMKLHNGGLLKKNCYVMKDSKTWAPDHIILEGIIGLGDEITYSLGGVLGTKYMVEDLGYPDIGVCICDTPAGYQEIIMLDYRKCGKDGEPEVVHVDHDFNYKITFVAKNFETFIKGLQSESHFIDEDEEELDNEVWVEEKF